MKKIMFNDKYGLTEAVLEGRKTQSRRLILSKTIEKAEQYRVDYFNNTLDNIPLEDMLIDANQLMGVPSLSSYHVGEEVAIAQSYEYLANMGGDILANMLKDESTFKKEYCGAGWSNKMFVRAEQMPHRIRITNIRVECLQDISDEDCMKEGILRGEFFNTWDEYYFEHGCNNITAKTARDAFKKLIDKVSGKGTWDSNPYVFVYEFELVK